MLSTGVALSLACVGFVFSEVVTVRKSLVKTYSTTADLLARKWAGALNTGAPANTRELLAGLELQPHVVSGCVYDRAGQVCASYHRGETSPGRPPAGKAAPAAGPLASLPPEADPNAIFPPQAPPPGSQFHATFLELCRPVVAGGQQIGSVYMKCDLEVLSSRLRNDVLIVVVLLAPALLGALLISTRLQRLVSGPILDLVAAARTVAAQRNYSVRVPSHGRDEVGQLIDGFNEMLVQIQARDAALQDARDGLEKRIQERTVELADSLSILHATLESTADGILVLDRHDKITNFNGKFARMWRVAGDLLVAKNETAVWHGMAEQLINSDRFELILRTPRAERKPVRWELMELKDGRVFEWHSQLQMIEAGIAGRVWSFRDISEHRRMETELARARDAALESARLKSEFLANMSHEIRTPMNGVIGMSNLLLDAGLPPRQRRYAEIIRESGNALLTLINDILDFSKIEARKLTFETVDFDLRELVEGTLELVGERAQAKKLELAACLAPEASIGLRGDPHRLRQVLLNLVGNAIKFTEQGEVVVRLALVSETATHARLRFEVKDTGIGIAPEVQDRLFRAFTQADGSTTRKHGGTGLGLAISKYLAEMMDGKIGVESEPDKGSVFWFTVQLEKQAASAAAKPVAGTSLVKLHVLIVDDSATNREILSHHARSWKMRPHAVAGGAEALDILRASAGDPFDLALLDLRMPKMDGLELAGAIKADPAIAGTRLVLLTSLGQGPSEAELKTAGIEGWLPKPVRQSQLFDCLSAAVGRTQLGETQPSLDLPGAVAPSVPLRILLAEDNAINQIVASEQLRQLGYHAEIVANGAAALEAFDRAPFDVILMDCQMPQMDGYEATREIRKRERLNHRQPVAIIAMTAHAMAGDREICLDSGMNDYLTKPVDAAQLRATLGRCAAAWLNPSSASSPWPIKERATHSPGAESPSSNSQGSPLDLVRFKEVTGGNPGQIRQLRELYLTQAEAILRAMAEALRSGNAPEVGCLAHKLAGSSGSIGVTGILPALRALEKTAKSGEMTGAPDLMDQAKRQVEAFQQLNLMAAFPTLSAANA